MVQKPSHLVRGIFRSTADQRANFSQSIFIAVNQRQSAFACKSLNPSDAGRDAALEMELEQPDLSGRANMRAAAKFGGKIADFHDPHPIAVFITEEGQSTLADRLVVLKLSDGYFGVLPNVLVDCGLDCFELLLGNGSRVVEIEAQSIRSDQRSRLAHVGPELLPQNRMQDMRCRVIKPGFLPILWVDLQKDLVANLNTSLFHFAPMRN